MSYSLNNITKLDTLLFDRENRAELAKTLNLKYNVWKYKNINYHILKYDKKYLKKEDVSSIGLLRSLIFKDDGTIVCFAPPKSFNSDNLVIEPNMNYVAEQFVEGTMMNAFYDTESNEWIISTRSSVGGEVSFFTDKGFDTTNKFIDMFNEVCEDIGLDWDELNKDYIYSFVMQHPRNRIVKPIVKMKLYLVEVYQIVENKTINIIPVTDTTVHCWFRFDNNTVKLPRSEFIKNDEDLELCKQIITTGYCKYSRIGVIIKNNLGQRYKFRNPAYEYVRRLRGNQPKLQFHYLTLRQMPIEPNATESKVSEYLKYYPEHKELFNEFRNTIHHYTSNLFVNYISCYIKKEKELHQFPEKYRHHMYILNQNISAKEMARTATEYITNKYVVIHYFNNLHPAQQMYVLNYDRRRPNPNPNPNAHNNEMDNNNIATSQEITV